MDEDFTELARFRSRKFAPALPEDCQVNPNVYGAELAFWLATTLAGKGVATSYPESEDWCWFIEYVDGAGSEFAVVCQNLEGSRDRWELSLRRHGRKMFGRDKPSWALAAPLATAILAVLREDPSVSELSWSFSERAGEP